MAARATFVLPFIVLALAGFALWPAADARTWSILAIGVVVLVVLGIVGPLQGDTGEELAAARRVLLRALLATMLIFSLCCGWIAAQGLDGALGIWPAILFVPCWLLFALLIPLWIDSPVVRAVQLDAGWKAIAGFKLIYANPDDAALWVYMKPQLPRDYRSALYTPNLGHRWGKAAMAVLVVLILAMMMLLVAASRPRGLLP